VPIGCHQSSALSAALLLLSLLFMALVIVAARQAAHAPQPTAAVQDSVVHNARTGRWGGGMFARIRTGGALALPARPSRRSCCS